MEKVKHQEKYERHVKWELAMEIELQKTLQARNRQILAIRLARCAVSDLEK